MKPQLLRKLNTTGNTWMVMNEENGCLYIHKTVAKSQLPIYAKLMEQELLHIPRVYSIENSADKSEAVVYMDFMEGVTLEYYISQGKTFTEKEVRSILLALSIALKELHKLGIVHCDVKPANVLMGSDGQIYLLDYDIARMLGVEVPEDLKFMGTKGFASPEQQMGCEADVRMDIFSLGMLGKWLLKNETTSSLQLFIDKCSAYDINERFESADAMILSLLE